MCGILVRLGEPPGPGDARWARAMARLSRRGPDGAGEWADPAGPVRMGHRRLAVVDLTGAGRQPMVGRSAAIVFNGEVYNAPDLRERLTARGVAFRSRSDTEVLLAACEAWGFEGALERLRGMFSFVLWDRGRRELLAAVDPAGQKPLVWSARQGALWIASDADALLEVLPRRPAPSGVGLCDVLCLGYCPPPRTVWEGVSKLPPGGALRFRPGVDERPTVWRWWSPPEEAAGPALSADGFDALWAGVIGEHLESDVPLGLFLSGGIDSSAVAAGLAGASAAAGATAAPARPRAITLSLPGADDEGPGAAETAAHLGLPHTLVPLEPGDVDGLLAAAAGAYDEPQGFGALLTAAAVCRAARPHGKVMLTGDGGDEAFAGYAWHRAAPPGPPSGAARRAAAVREHAPTAAAAALPHADGATRARAMRAMAALSFTHAHLHAVMPRFHPAEAAALLAALSPPYDEGVYAGWAGEHDRPSMPWPRRAQRLDLLTFCAGSILPKMDRASMAVGLELRAPFLDRRVLEAALSARPGPTEPGEARPVVREWLSRPAPARDECHGRPPGSWPLSPVPGAGGQAARGPGRVPPSVLTRRKQGFSLRLPDPSVWVERLASVRQSRLVRDGVLRPDFERYVGPDAPHRAGRAYALVFLAAWYERRAGDGA